VQPDTDLERQLRALEESHLRHEVRSSPESMRALLGEEFVEFGSSGRVFDRAAAITLVSGRLHSTRALTNSVCGLSLPGLP
jgi:hypothetical protein